MKRQTLIILLLFITPLLWWGKSAIAYSDGTYKRDTTTDLRRKIERHLFKLDSIGDIIHTDTVTLEVIKGDPNRKPYHIGNLIANILFSTPKPDSTLSKVKKFAPFVGERIDSIVIINRNSFKDIAGTKSLFDHISNGLTTRTKESTIRKYLLFKEGDVVNSEDVIKSEAMLRDTRAISSAEINLERLPCGGVVAFVTTEDSWNISMSLIYRYTNNGTLELTDYNFLGSGNRLSINQYYNAKREEWFKGLEAEYYIPNLWGKFIEVSLGGGYGGDDFHSLFLKADKYFVHPNDWAGGINLNRRNEQGHIAYENMYVGIDKFIADVWFGQSINISPRWGDNFYYAVKYQSKKHYKRPYHSPTYNPYFHNSQDLLISLGMYKEKFYRGNMIYSYGATESIPYGYNTELILGYRKGEFDSSPYIGTRLSIGNIINIGYISGSIKGGMYLDETESLRNTRIEVDFLYFTHLQRLGNSGHLRQFVNINYASGLDVLDGAYTEFEFKGISRLRQASYSARGTTRINMNLESVFFTPYHVSGFRFALFGFTDFGTIGYNQNPFRNDFYMVAGGGIRVRNEALIFKTIELKVVFALKGHPEYRNNLFYISSDMPLEAGRYIPSEPEIFDVQY